MKSGHRRIDTAKVRAEERLDGNDLLSTSDADLSAEDVALGRKNLLEAERGFRDMKPTLIYDRSITASKVVRAPTCCCVCLLCC